MIPCGGNEEETKGELEIAKVVQPFKEDFPPFSS